MLSILRRMFGRKRPDGAARVRALIAQVDREISRQLDQILHDPAFQQLEGAWRGLHFLVQRVAECPGVEIRVLHVSEAGLRQAVTPPSGAPWQQAPLARWMFEDIHATPARAPLAVLMVDAMFDHGTDSVALLSGLARICDRSKTPMLAGASAQLWGGGQLPGHDRIEQALSGPDHATWTALRDQGDSRFVGLCLPRLLARAPYARTDDGAGFQHTETTDPIRSSDFTWMNPAHAVAANIARAVATTGWPVDMRGIESGGRVSGLPLRPAGDGLSPLEIPVDERQESHLARSGLIAAIQRRNMDDIAFLAAPSLKMRAGADTDLETAKTENFVASLQNLLLVCRYGQYVMRMAADLPRDGFQARVRDWLAGMVDPDSWQKPVAERALRPLYAASFDLSNDGRTATLEIRAGHRLEDGGRPMRIDLDLPEPATR